LHLEPAHRVLERVAAGQAVFGPDLGTWIRSLPSASQEGTDPTHSSEAFPQASDVALLGAVADPVPPETLAPVYLREAAFVKAPPHRVIPGITD